MASRKGSRTEPRGDKRSRLRVQPAELARKLVKEMEDHKVSRSTHVSVRNRYTIYLCPQDYERLSQKEHELLDKFERHLAKHARSKGYRLSGDINVLMDVDSDLRLGYFGVLAERVAPGLAEQDLPARMRMEEAVRAEPAAVNGAGRVAMNGAGRVAVNGGVPSASPATPARPRLSGAQTVGGATEVISGADAAHLGLARQIIVVTIGNAVREFNQGRVIVGRSRDVDLVIDNPDVSRRHAVLYWANGDVVLEDLDSTNGTLVNGYPVSSTILGPGDVVTIGDCRLTAGTR